MGTGTTPRAEVGGSEPAPGGADRPPFPFLIGSGRSGSTLVRAMLDSHPEVAVPPETYFVTELLPNAAEWDAPGGFAADKFLDEVLVHQFFVRWGLPAESVREAFAAQPPAGYADAIRLLYGLYADAHGKRRYADKTPVYIYDVLDLAALFPEARFVHLIRDGRDVAASFLDQEDMRPNGIAEAALLWRERVSAGRSAGATLGAGRYAEVRYEDLVRDPEAVLRRVAEFIGIDYHPAMLTYPERARDLVAADGGAQRHRGVFTEPQAGFRDWRTELSAAEVEVFEVVAGDLLEELGYPRGADTRWAGDREVVGLLVGEVERLRQEVVTTEQTLRRRIRMLRRRLRRASAEPRDPGES